MLHQISKINANIYSKVALKYSLSRLQDFKVIKLLIYIPFIHEKK